MELRFNENHDTRIEERADGKTYLTGYASVFYKRNDSGTEFVLWEGAVERFHRNAFDKVLRSGDNVECRYNHSKDFILGDTDSGQLKLSVDQRGLRYEIPYDSSDPDMLKVRSKISKKLIRGSSIGFIPSQMEWTTEENTDVCTIKDLELLRDVGPVNTAAYGNSTADIRSSENQSSTLRESHRLWKETQKRLA